MAQEEIDILKREYLDLLHAVQTGVMYKMKLPGDKSTEPKMLRTGINTALVQEGAVVSLLIKKGIFTEQEYWESCVVYLRAEVKSYEEELSKHFSSVVHLK
jgi:hypothetical protein